MHHDQFTATGPPDPLSGIEAAAFSTLQEDRGFQWGVRAVARRCGVTGQTIVGGIAGVLGDGRRAQFGALGIADGENVGVVGVSVDNANEIFNLNVPPGSFRLTSLGDGIGTGVLGKSGTGFGVHGISVKDTGVLGASESGFGVHGVSQSDTGVLGTSGSGFGVHGASVSDTGVRGNSDDGFGVHGASVSDTGVLGNSDDGFGVHGVGRLTGIVGDSELGIGGRGSSYSSTGILGTSRFGVGVHGRSDDGPGGVFQSDHAAQVRLVPLALSSPQGRVMGDGGELLATTETDRSGQPVFSLWFCTRAGSEATAAWQYVAGPSSSSLPGAPAVTDPGSVLAHMAALANARHVFVIRLIEDGRVAEAAAATPAAIEAYRQLAGTPGADLVRVAAGLLELSGQLTGTGLAAESATAAHAAVEALAVPLSAAAEPGSLLAHVAALANARHVFVIRLLQDARVDEAAAASPAAIEAYRQLAGTPGADLVRVAAGLHELSGQLTEAGLTALSAAAAHAAVEALAGPSQPSTEPGSVLVYLAAVANARRLAVIRLLQDGRVEEAADANLIAIEAYRQLAGTPDADLVSVATRLHRLSDELAEAGLTAESVAAANAASSVRKPGQKLRTSV